MFKNWAFAIGLILTLSLLWPLFKAPYFSHQDDVHLIRIYEMDKCFKDNQIPCRWVPDLGDMYGYPLFNYYAPLPYYFGELFYFLSGSVTLAAKIMFATPFIGAFIFMYLLSRRLWGNIGGALSGIFYSFAPYHAVVFYVRGTVGELWALMFFPAIIWLIWRLKETSRLIYAILTGLFLGFLILSHNLSLMIFIPVLLILVGFFIYQTKSIRLLKLTVLSLILSLMISAFYWIPMIFEQNLVHIETTTLSYFGYTEHYKGIRKLLTSGWGYNVSNREVPGGPPDTMSYQIGWVHLIGWGLALASAVHFWKKKRSISLLILLSSLVITFSIFMINPRSILIWQIFEPLKYLQYPWRFLMVVIFLISLIVGSVSLWLKNGPVRIILLGLVVMVVAVNFNYFKPQQWVYLSDQELMSGASWSRQVARSIFDFLPIGAEKPPSGSALGRYEILDGTTQINNFKEGTNWITFDTVTDNRTIIRLSQYNFPNWKVWVDGQLIKIDPGNTYGLITFLIGEGNHHIEARLIDTPLRTISNLISIGGVVILLILLITQIKPTRRWIMYYLSFLGR